VPDEPLVVDADPVRLEQVLTNLLTNANKYTEPGGAIWLTAVREGSAVVVRVRDTGIGISSELLPRVFDLFTQAETARDRPGGGLGIGLTVVKRLVELHGGTIEAQSAGLGQGSEFVIHLPLAEAGTSAPPLGSAVPAKPAPRRRVALVEDDADSREVLADLLELLGHQVLSAANGDEALRLAQTDAPEAFVVDLGLPGRDGYEVARALRQQPGGEHVLLIALSSYGSPEDKDRARKAGFDAHLTKPANIEELERLLAMSPSDDAATRNL
jgi:CheY-like chemotaxis protein